MPKTPNTRLRTLLAEADWSGAQLAAALRQVAAEHGRQLACDRSMVSRWLSGTTPRPPVPQLLLEALSRRLGRPVDAVEAGLSRPPCTVLDLSWEADPLRRLTALTRAHLDPERRRLLHAGVYSLAMLANPVAWSPDAKPPAGSAPDSDGARGRPGRGEVEQMQTMARVFAEAAQLHGSGHVRTALAAYLGHDVAGYLQAPAAEHTHRQLLTGAAQLITLLGTMSADSGADALAQRYHHTAARLAADAGDRAVFAITLRAMATHAHDLGHRTPAVMNLAGRAADAARNAPRIVRAYTQAHLAVTAAPEDRHTALTALRQAEQLHQQADSAPGPFTAYPLAALHYQRAQTLAALGERSQAIGAYTASLRLRTATERHARTLTHAHLAETLLAHGHLDAALTHWTHFLDNYPHLSSVRAARRLDVMRRHLVPHHRHRPAAALLDRAAPLR
ncbi:hypothetical protein AB0D98_30990 [Streptomyces sp. NPDC047987]|uniref:hypothetical protein n=1 Tax=unclassified Streptomyces TaxID=2593676 RepID=UPI0034155BC5